MRLARRLARGAGAALAAAGLLALDGRDTTATHVPPIVVEGNPTCAQFGLLQAGPDIAGNGTFPVPSQGSVTVSNFNGLSFDWTATFGIDKVIVKGGPDANVYSYEEAMADTGLVAPLNPNTADPNDTFPISHIRFCFDVTPTPTPTATPTGTATATPTPTPSATPTGTATATPTPTPSATPTATPAATETATPVPTPSPTATPTSPAIPTPTPTPAPSGENGEEAAPPAPPPPAPTTEVLATPPVVLRPPPVVVEVRPEVPDGLPKAGAPLPVGAGLLLGLALLGLGWLAMRSSALTDLAPSRVRSRASQRGWPNETAGEFELRERLYALERQHGISSGRFLWRYNRDLLTENPAFDEWHRLCREAETLGISLSKW